MPVEYTIVHFIVLAIAALFALAAIATFKDKFVSCVMAFTAATLIGLFAMAVM